MIDAATAALGVVRMALLFGAIGFGGYAFGTPGTQALAAVLCGACIGFYVGLGLAS